MVLYNLQEYTGTHWHSDLTRMVIGPRPTGRLYMVEAIMISESREIM